eukprot:NODE_35_length_31537_cov_0.293403.p20 type:complete len:116 gc:universal NODE_35_length_31537_cov_0.293403:17957-18304(+)
MYLIPFISFSLFLVSYLEFACLNTSWHTFVTSLKELRFSDVTLLPFSIEGSAALFSQLLIRSRISTSNVMGESICTYQMWRDELMKTSFNLGQLASFKFNILVSLYAKNFQRSPP